MGFTNSEQVYELFLACGLGFLLGFYYDGFRLLRRFCRVPKFGLFLLDVLFFATAAVAVFLFSLAMTEGEVRSYSLLGSAVGFFAYRCTVGRVLLRALYGVSRTVRRVLAVFVKPFGWLFEKVRKFYGKTAKKSEKIFKKVLQPVRGLLYNHRV